MATDPRFPLVRRPLGVLLALLLPVLYVVAGTGAAHAASGYKYWNYFHVQGGTYAFAKSGPADYQPRNGAVEAYRYGLSSSAKGLQPRTGATTYPFDKLCAGTKAQEGQKRVGVLVDYGTRADAAGGDRPPQPRGACAVVPTNANGQQVLDAVSDVRVQGGLVCGIDGYPATGCSVTVKDPPAAQAEQDVDFKLPAAASPSGDTADAAGSDDDGGGVPWTLVGVVAAVVVIGGGALALSRRNRTT